METSPSPKTRRVLSMNNSTVSRWTLDEDQLLLTIFSNATTKVRWVDLEKVFPGKSSTDISRRWNNVLNPNLAKGSFSKEDDNAIHEWVKENGPVKWNLLSKHFPTCRTGKQLRERWYNCLAPHNTSEWTPEEDFQIILWQQNLGNKWKEISNILVGRTENQIKNRWNKISRMNKRIINGESPCRKRGRKKAQNAMIKKPNNAIKVDDFDPFPYDLTSGFEDGKINQNMNFNILDIQSLLPDQKVLESEFIQNDRLSIE